MSDQVIPVEIVRHYERVTRFADSYLQAEREAIQMRANGWVDVEILHEHHDQTGELRLTVTGLILRREETVPEEKRTEQQ